MLLEDLSSLIVEQTAIPSKFLKRYVIVDLYLPRNIADPSELSLLLINDGQNLEEFNFAGLLDKLVTSGQILPIFCAGIHAGKDRKNEYGTATVIDYEGRGKKSAAYQQFIIEELIPYIHLRYRIDSFRQKAIAGFSLGGLSALDLAWNHPEIFSTVGVFSGSLWWRTKSLEKDYNDATDRIMHALVRSGTYHPGLRFYFMTGSMDETADRNGNGIIDSIDDTLDLIRELEQHGYVSPDDITYVNYKDGRHDVETWGRSLPPFLLWGWGVRSRGIGDQDL